MKSDCQMNRRVTMETEESKWKQKHVVGSSSICSEVTPTSLSFHLHCFGLKVSWTCLYSQTCTYEMSAAVTWLSQTDQFGLDDQRFQHVSLMKATLHDVRRVTWSLQSSNTQDELYSEVGNICCPAVYLHIHTSAYGAVEPLRHKWSFKHTWRRSFKFWGDKKALMLERNQFVGLKVFVAVLKSCTWRWGNTPASRETHVLDNVHGVALSKRISLYVILISDCSW